MAYRIRRKDPTVEQAVRRIAAEQAERAVYTLRTGTDLASVNAEVRWRCHKVLALIALVEPVFAHADAARDALKQAAAKLPPQTGNRVLGGLALVGGSLRNASATGDAKKIRKLLDQPASERLAGRGAMAAMAECRAGLVAFGKGIGAWTLSADGWEAIAGGLRATLHQSTIAAKAFHAHSDSGSLQALRKHVRQHRCHIRLLRKIDPAGMHARLDHLERLAAALEAQRNLRLLRDALEKHAGQGDAGALAEKFVVLSSRQGAMIADGIRQDLKTLHTAFEDTLMERWEADWHAWRKVIVAAD